MPWSALGSEFMCCKEMRKRLEMAKPQSGYRQSYSNLPIGLLFWLRKPELQKNLCWELKNFPWNIALLSPDKLVWPYPATDRIALTPAPRSAVSSSGGSTSSEKLCSGVILTMVSRWLRSKGSSRKRTLEPVK